MALSDSNCTIFFLDRDGTVNIDHGYVTSPERVELIPGVARSLGEIKRKGHKLVVVSNQSAIGRGMATADEVNETNNEVARQLISEDSDACIDLFLFSPDHPDKATNTRKPDTGLLEQLPASWNYRLADCYMVGDKGSDIEFGINAGIPEKSVFLVLTGNGETTRQRVESKYPAVNIVDSLACISSLVRNVG